MASVPSCQSLTALEQASRAASSVSSPEEARDSTAFRAARFPLGLPPTPSNTATRSGGSSLIVGNEAWVRGQVFKAFNGQEKAEVDAYLTNFYDEYIEKRFRPKADEAMRACAEEGCRVIVVSASFEPIVLRAMEKHPFHHQIRLPELSYIGLTSNQVLLLFL